MNANQIEDAATGESNYRVHFARLIEESECVSVWADSCDEAVEKAVLKGKSYGSDLYAHEVSYVFKRGRTDWLKYELIDGHWQCSAKEPQETASIDQEISTVLAEFDVARAKKLGIRPRAAVRYFELIEQVEGCFDQEEKRSLISLYTRLGAAFDLDPTKSADDYR